MSFSFAVARFFVLNSMQTGAKMDEWIKHGKLGFRAKNTATVIAHNEKKFCKIFVQNPLTGFQQAIQKHFYNKLYISNTNFLALNDFRFVLPLPSVIHDLNEFFSSFSILARDFWILWIKFKWMHGQTLCVI